MRDRLSSRAPHATAALCRPLRFLPIEPPPDQPRLFRLAQQRDVTDQLGAADAALKHELAAVELLQLRAMADADDGKPRHLVDQKLHQRVLALRIQRGGGFIEHDNVGPVQQQARNRQTLLFAA